VQCDLWQLTDTVSTDSLHVGTWSFTCERRTPRFGILDDPWIQRCTVIALSSQSNRRTCCDFRFAAFRCAQCGLCYGTVPVRPSVRLSVTFWRSCVTSKQLNSGAVTSVGWQITLCDPIDKWRPVVLRWISLRTIRSFTFFFYISSNCFSSSDSPIVIVFIYKILWRNLDGFPLNDSDERWWDMKNRAIYRFISETIQDSQSYCGTPVGTRIRSIECMVTFEYMTLNNAYTQILRARSYLT